MSNLTPEELVILGYLTAAYNTFVSLPDKHPDDDEECHRAIHTLQQLIALRVARRVDPEVWQI